MVEKHRGPPGPRFYFGGISVEISAQTGRGTIPGCKQRGEWAELVFMARAVERGLAVSRPHGDSTHYDVGVEHAGRFSRVQVKSTTFSRKGSFTCNILGPQRKPYAPGLLDFFAIYLVPVDLWYIIPFVIATGNLSLNLTPRQGHKFAQYMEAWNLMTCADLQKSFNKLSS